MRGNANALAMRGNSIRIASPDKDMKPPKGVLYIHFERVYSQKHVEQRTKIFEQSQKMMPLTAPFNLYTRQYDFCNGFFFVFVE